MDEETFDRLSVGVHRLRERVTRRGTLGVLLGGALAAVGMNADEADAKRRRRRKKKNRKGCKGFGGRCRSNRDCCNGRCQGRFCFPSGGGGGGNGCCRGFPSDYRCCRFNGVDFCVPRNHRYCRDGDICPAGWETCGWNGPVRTCCSPETHCCDNDFCLHDMFDCDDFFDVDSSSADGATESSRDTAVTDPIPVTEIDPAEFD